MRSQSQGSVSSKASKNSSHHFIISKPCLVQKLSWIMKHKPKSCQPSRSKLSMFDTIDLRQKNLLKVSSRNGIDFEIIMISIVLTAIINQE
jgi:hypothetical protein